MSNIMVGTGPCVLPESYNLVLLGSSSDGLGVSGGESVCTPMRRPEKQEKKNGYAMLLLSHSKQSKWPIQWWKTPLPLSRAATNRKENQLLVPKHLRTLFIPTNPIRFSSIHTTHAANSISTQKRFSKPFFVPCLLRAESQIITQRSLK